MSLFHELKRRNVFRVGIAYAVAAWVLLQLTDVVGEILELPAWGGKLILLVLVIGFFLALLLAWAYELTPEGVKRESEVADDASITRHTGRRLNALIIGLMAVAIAYLLFDKFWLQPRLAADTETAATPVPALATEAEQPVDSLSAGPEAAPPADARPSIAVLPFDNRSNREEDRFFTDGIHDDLLTTIAKIGSLKVISRTSVMEYRGTTRKIPEIARELGVDHVLEGGIQRSGDVVRVNVQLIDAGTDEHLWAERYDRQLTAENLFSIQNEISRAVAAALQTTLTPSESQQLDRKPTDNLAAYDAYLKARQLMVRRTSTALEEARQLLELATELDPAFALAHAGLAEALYLLTVYGTLPQHQALPAVLSAAKRALEIDPALGEAYAALAKTHEISEHFDDADAAYSRALELAPNYATAWHWYFGFLAREPERLAAAIAASEKARELDPRSSIIRLDAARLYETRGDFEEARRLYLEVIELDPEFVPAYAALSELEGGSFGDLPEAYRWALETVRRDRGNMWAWGNLVFPLSTVGARTQAEEILSTAQAALQRDDVPAREFDWIRAYLAVEQHEYDAALEWVGGIEPNPSLPSLNWGLGQMLAYAGEYERARAVMFVGASDFGDRDRWDRLLAQFKEDGCIAGWVLMQSGEETLGRELLQRTIDYVENVLPRYVRRAERDNAAACHAALGNRERALDALEGLLDVKQYWSWRWTLGWPPVRPLADDPRLQALNERFEAEMERQRPAVVALHEERFGEVP